MKTAKDLLKDKELMAELANLFTDGEFDDIVWRLKNADDDFFADAANALAMEAMFDSDRAKATPPMELQELLTREEALLEMAWALVVDHIGAKEIKGLLSRDPREIKNIMDRAEECKARIIERIFAENDPLFTIIVCRLAAIMLVNVENLNGDWERISNQDEPKNPDDPKNKPN